jgi:TPR repeat protein
MAKSSGPASPPSLMPPKACEPLAAGTKLEGTGQAVPPVIAKARDTRPVSIMNDQAQAKQIPTRWLRFCERIVLPGGAGLTILQAIKEQPSSTGEAAIMWLLVIGYAALALAVAYGLQRRRLWAWRAFWVVLSLQTTSWLLAFANLAAQYPQALKTDWPALVVCLVLISGWTFGNAIYFRKRRTLFSCLPGATGGDGQKAEVEGKAPPICLKTLPPSSDEQPRQTSGRTGLLPKWKMPQTTVGREAAFIIIASVVVFCLLQLTSGTHKAQTRAEAATNSWQADAQPNRPYTVDRLEDLRARAEKGDAEARYRLALRYWNGVGVQQNYTEAAKLYKGAAEEGNARAQAVLGYCYYEGVGVVQDYNEAVKWNRKAAEQGDATAEANLALSYGQGRGVARDYAEAVKWYRKAAEQGDANAQCNLGFCYCLGQGVHQDYLEAVNWFRKAVEQENAIAQYCLGCCYDKGQGVQQDYAEAANWFRKTAEQGNAAAQGNLGFCYYLGQGVQQDYAEAVNWSRKGAEQGQDNAQCYLGLCYYTGNGVQQDYPEAAKWFQKAASQGFIEAKFHLGVCYALGYGVERDERQAAKLELEAAENGHRAAQYIMGVTYREGAGVSRDYVQAARWHTKAADQGADDAQVELGKLYSSGLGVPQDQRKAAAMFRRAAAQGNVKGQFFVGNCYWRGEGVPQDFGEAYKWFNLAAAQGDTLARECRDLLQADLTQQQVSDGQRRASAFVAKKERPEAGADGISPIPEIDEGRNTPKIAEWKRCAGTGFFVTEDGYFVTCEHVVRGASFFHVRSSSGYLPARLIKKDRTIDVAVLKVDGAFRALPVAAQLRVKLGEAVFTIGFPNPNVQGIEPKLTRGEISSMAGIRDNPRYFQISVPVQPGNSGGALLDECGNAVGVVTSRLDDAATFQASGALPQNVNYAVKSGLVYSFLSGVPELSGKLKKPCTGKDREAASGSAERAAVLVIAE